MSEPTFNLTGQVVMAILGQKEVERLLLIQRVTELEAQVKALSPQEPAGPPV